jgi:hypothetical protein
MKQGRPVMAGCTKDPAVSAGRQIAPRPRIGFLDSTSREDALLLDENCAGMVATLFVGPDPRGDAVDRINDVLRSSSPRRSS